MVVFCVVMFIIFGYKRSEIEEGIEMEWMVNYFVNVYLLGILSFVIKV